MKKLVFAGALCIVLGSIGFYLYTQPKFLQTEEDFIAVFSDHIVLENPDNLTLLHHENGNTAWVFCIDGENYYAMKCEIVDEKAVFVDMEDLQYYTRNIVYTSDSDGAILINDPRCTHIEVADDTLKKEFSIPIESLPQLVAFDTYRPSRGSWGCRDAQGNDLQFK
ncbi:hypothetical protein RFF05_18120 [Bengtsoniella intestinalis]|uniref:hypothetical protein n=1 Tax=Bengtsoniella intestinalis TaxID=3073143 RepID=UPI00391F225B